MTMKDCLALRREEIHRAMIDAMQVLDGTTTPRVSLLTGIAPEDINRLGGIQE
ncbi:MAG: hypothetical protein QG608_3283 [Actinomycetota bacterium]|nr:hypothetical protein [Actinomycetota bacterium]